MLSMLKDETSAPFLISKEYEDFIKADIHPDNIKYGTVLSNHTLCNYFLAFLLGRQRHLPFKVIDSVTILWC